MISITRLSITRLFAVALIGLAATGCKNEVKVGAVLPLSGEHHTYGEASRQGLELALEELKAGGDTRFQLTVVDSESDPAKARQLLEGLYDENAVVAIGGLTATMARELASVAEDAERVLLSPSATLRDQASGMRYFYSLATKGFTSGTSMATFVKRELKVGNAVVIREPGMGEGLEKGFRSTFENQGGKILASLSASKTPEEIRSTVGQALTKRPAAIFLAGYEGTVSPFVHELRRRQYRGKILTTQALACHDSLRELGDDARGVLLTHTAFEPGTQQHVSDFVARFEKKFGRAPDIHAAESYDAMMVLATAMKDRPGLPSEVRKGLIHDVKDYPGVTGSLQFNEEHNVPRIPRIYSIAKDLTLQDHGRILQAERERIEAEKRKLIQRLGEIHNSGATQASSG